MLLPHPKVVIDTTSETVTLKEWHWCGLCTAIDHQLLSLAVTVYQSQLCTWPQSFL